MPRQPDTPKTGGRQAGTPNKVTADARKAIAEFVNNNSHRLTEWLDKVANGDPKHDIPPNPAKAFDMFQSVVEYHVPKLARTEVTGADNGPIKVQQNVTVFGELLKAIKMERQSDE